MCTDKKKYSPNSLKRIEHSFRFQPFFHKWQQRSWKSSGRLLHSTNNMYKNSWTLTLWNNFFSVCLRIPNTMLKFYNALWVFFPLQLSSFIMSFYFCPTFYYISYCVFIRIDANPLWKIHYCCMILFLSFSIFDSTFQQRNHFIIADTQHTRLCVVCQTGKKKRKKESIPKGLDWSTSTSINYLLFIYLLFAIWIINRIFDCSLFTICCYSSGFRFVFDYQRLQG